jgi:short-subunit dehydrogenase
VFGESDSNINKLINCNVVSCTKMTAICLPVMLRKRKGIIINNASASGRIPTPMLTVYSATKAYMDFFSRALNTEYANKGIIVQSLNPYFVSTKVQKLTVLTKFCSANIYINTLISVIVVCRPTFIYDTNSKRLRLECSSNHRCSKRHKWMPIPQFPSINLNYEASLFNSYTNKRRL